jgi:hypothetical protein
MQQKYNFFYISFKKGRNTFCFLLFSESVFSFHSRNFQQVFGMKQKAVAVLATA